MASVNGCSAFFVKTSKNTNYLISAYHCLLEQKLESCEQQEIFDFKYVIKRECLGYLVKSKDNDIVVMEVSGPLRPQSDNLTLAKFSPRPLTRLKVIGLPLDPYSQETISTSENCWLLSDKKVIAPQKSKGFFNSGLYYNCSVYKGNSGGPVLIEGSSLVVGLPLSYHESDYLNNKASDKKSYFSLMSEFVDRYYADLRYAQIEMSDHLFYDLPLAKYVANGVYTSNEMPGLEVVLSATYNTSSALQKVELEFFKNKKSSSSKLQYRCYDDVCLGPSQTRVRIEDSQFFYTDRFGHISRFSPKR